MVRVGRSGKGRGELDRSKPQPGPRLEEGSHADGAYNASGRISPRILFVSCCVEGKNSQVSANCSFMRLVGISAWQDFGARGALEILVIVDSCIAVVVGHGRTAKCCATARCSTVPAGKPVVSHELTCTPRYFPRSMARGHRFLYCFLATSCFCHERTRQPTLLALHASI